MRKAYIDMLSDSSGRDDDYYYLMFDEETAEVFVEHSWHYYKYARPAKQGSSKMSLADLKQEHPDVYQKAVVIILAGFPAEQDQEQLS